MELKVDSDKFIEEIQRRGVEYLIHFTPTLNLLGMFEQGKLMSRKMIRDSDLDVVDILDYVQFTDDVRYDDDRYINLSISGPNTFLLKRFKEKTRNDMTINWCILKISTKYIYERHTKFSVTNAASNAAKKIGISGDYEKFCMMFAERLNINYGVRGNIKLCYTTNEQAEVLVLDTIPLDAIENICFQNYSDLDDAKSSFYSFDTSRFCVDNQIFSPNRYK